ncbi:putative cytochrome P450 6a13 [Haemaphysalis longicornis]
MLNQYFWAWVTALVTCGFYGLYRWVLRERRKWFDAFKDTGIPGPPIDSLINGNSDAFFKPTQIESINRWLKQYGDVFGFFLGAVPIVVIKNLDMIKDIMNKDFSNFVARGHMKHLCELQPLMEDSIGFGRGRAWREARACMQQFFTQSKMKAVMPSLLHGQRQFIKVLGATADRGAEVDITKLCERFTFDVISKTAFGIDTEVQKNQDNPLFQAAIVVFPNSMNGFAYHMCQNLFDWPRLLRLLVKVLSMIFSDPAAEMRSQAKAVIEFRRQNPQVNLPDMAQILIDDALCKRNAGRKMAHLTTESRAPLSPTELDKLAGNGMCIFMAGYDTTRLTLTYWFYLMAKHPDIQEKMRKEALEAYKAQGDHLPVETLTNLSYTHQVISETLRMYPPVVTFTTRCAEEDYRCRSYLIKKGTSVLIPVYQLHHDPLLWTDPEKFDPDRQVDPENKHLVNPIAYQPFGLGPRMCIGSRLGLLELASVTTQVLRHFRISLGPSQKPDLELETYALFAGPKDGVWIKLQKL